MIGKTYQKLYREWLDKAIYKFHNLVNTNEIARQLSEKPATEVLILPTIEFKIWEWATIARILFKPFKNNNICIKFVYTLA